ncbi:MAG: hypothetical protein JO110_20420 [Acetobacteraceae bacterium]|nr:hypothetical protein [Acetobacteraceae bacterium]
MGDLLGENFAVVAKDTLYRCLDKLLAQGGFVQFPAATLEDAVPGRIRSAAL